MFFIDHPFISEFLLRTLSVYQIPVINTPVMRDFDVPYGSHVISEQQIRGRLQNNSHPQIYVTSDNAFHWLAQYPEAKQYMNTIGQFKDKVAFRRALSPLFPDFFFQEVNLEDLSNFDTTTINTPCIIKPSIGFFSLGVYRVDSESDWPRVIDNIFTALDAINMSYPEAVVNTQQFIIEELIEGDEFAVDGYYNAQGEPVILGIYEHYFASEKDMSDRIYTTSAPLMRNNIGDFASLLTRIGTQISVKNFPFHMELRRTSKGELVPIEINPGRFGGWCSTPDLGYLAYGINPYVAFYQKREPDWNRALREFDDKLFSLIVLDNNSGYSADQIDYFDYDRLTNDLEKVLEIRKTDFHRHPLFGFLFVETRSENKKELSDILTSDLRRYIHLHQNA